MSFGWQDILVLAICLAAAAYVARLVWKSLAGRATAGCSSGCGKCSTSQPKAVLTIEPADIAKIDP
jgi:hypothetical protein